MTSQLRALELISEALAEFHSWVELPRLGHLSTKLMCEFTDDSKWSDLYLANCNLPGCYLFENNDGQIYYVGSVSANSSFGYRFANGYVSRDKDKIGVVRGDHAVHARRIYVIGMPPEYSFVAPALEQFLITYLGRLSPETDLVNKKDSVAALAKELDDRGVPETEALTSAGSI